MKPRPHQLIGAKFLLSRDRALCADDCRTGKPSVADIRKLLFYDAATGRLYWKARSPDQFADGERGREWNCARFNSRFAGKRAGHRGASGYLFIRIWGRLYRAHQVVWFLETSEWPPLLDHRDGDTTNDAFSNLRLASALENSRNGKKPKSNTSGLKGVSWAKRERKWRAYIVDHYKQQGLGYFDCPAAAYFAYVVAADRLHGDFARFA